MAMVYKRTQRKPIPKGAELVERKGQRFATWTDSAGRHRARLTDDGKAILIERPGYEIQYFDENGQRRKESVRCGDRDTAERIAAEREKAVLFRQKGYTDAAQERLAAETRRPLGEHVDDYRAFLLAKGNTARHVAETLRSIRRVVELCGADRPGELTGPKVMKAVGGLREAGASHRTCNAYLVAVKGLTRWMWRHKRAADDPLCTLTKYNEATDPRHVRRELSPEEINWLLRSAESRSEPGHSLPGPDRAMVYRLALGTGFRVKELRSLTPESFDLDGAPPTVTVEAAYSKHRREDRQPIRSDLAEILRPWLAAKPAGERLFARLPGHTARMLRGDLEAARAAWIEAAAAGPEREARERSDFLKYHNAAGEVADFHGATRHTYISGIVATGASVKTCQELARHSDPSLTIGRYSHARLHDLQGALEALPALSPEPEGSEAERGALRATGTDGAAKPAKDSGRRGAGQVNSGSEKWGQKWGQLSGGGWSETAKEPLIASGTGLTPTTSESDSPPTPQVVGVARNKKSRRVLATPGSEAEGKGFEPSTGFPAPDFESGR
jgi:integrase